MHISTALLSVASAAFLAVTSAAPTDSSLEARKSADVKGIKTSFVTHEHVDWEKYKKDGYKFGYSMATEGDDYKSPYFYEQYNGCRKAGLICGAYHVADLTKGSGSDQAKYFVKNGGDWKKKDKKKLPGALKIGYTNNKETCYGLSSWEIIHWIRDFSDKYYDLTHRYPVINTSYQWWKECTNNDTSFKSKHALWLVGSTEVPGGWHHWSFLEYEDKPEDLNAPKSLKWHSDASELRDFAQKS
ncbi:hypothetical protein FRC03_012550 [Tulasnella sp. 419]|nr:hypothetical protein FRC02_007994 [Tulasnella sp. 418]KAG8966066.1 hypothetical protein FRC03_012550 [Tulasnella sp. 419]